MSDVLTRYQEWMIEHLRGYDFRYKDDEETDFGLRIVLMERENLMEKGNTDAYKVLPLDDFQIHRQYQGDTYVALITTSQFISSDTSWKVIVGWKTFPYGEHKEKAARHYEQEVEKLEILDGREIDKKRQIHLPL